MKVESRSNSEQLLDALIDAEVLSPVDEELAVSTTFVRERDRTEDRLEDCNTEAVRTELESVTDSTAEVDALLGVSDAVPSVVAEYLALAERTDLSHPDRLQALSFVDTLLGSPPTIGAPAAFVPVTCDRLLFHVALHEKVIVYIWREDCPPCDQVRETFDEIFDEPPEDLALLAVYGPNAPAKLDEWYDVVGGPATLFLDRGEPEARMYGAYARSVFETEINRHRQLG